MCKLRDCSVCECPETEFPELFKKPSQYALPSDDLKCQEGKPEAAVDRTLDSKAFRGWMEVDNPWTNDDETDNSKLHLVFLRYLFHETQIMSYAMWIHLTKSSLDCILAYFLWRLICIFLFLFLLKSYFMIGHLITYGKGLVMSLCQHKHNMSWWKSGLLSCNLIICLYSFLGEMTYVNLLLNPERYTGYTGPSARRIWDAVYSENCPQCKLVVLLNNFESLLLLISLDGCHDRDNSN